MIQWNPDLYLKYQDERTQPAHDLISRIAVADPVRIADIGCGPGNSTRALRERWPRAEILGLDNSAEMIEKARSAYPPGRWILADAAEWKPDAAYNIVFSNAALQWIPDHETLIPALFGAVESPGALAVQVPANGGSPLHQAVLKVSRMEEWKNAVAGCEELIHYHDAGFYHDLLSALAGRIQIWQTTYFHVMADHQGLMDWYAGTGMKPYLERLADDGLKKLFQSRVLDECRAAYPVQRDGRILFPFQRLFFLATRD
jgi:trans-aconitate 2-methyltransferase